VKGLHSSVVDLKRSVSPRRPSINSLFESKNSGVALPEIANPVCSGQEESESDIFMSTDRMSP